ncbi:MAG: bifunctional riboflavin kinase/FAD synthetase [Desulfohalobiaceae bacterium]
MSIATNLEELSPYIQAGTCATIGNFDGVHLGHQTLLQKVQRKSAQCGLPSVAVTFEPHPLQVLQGWTPPFITDPEQKLELMQKSGIEHILCLKFDRNMAELSPEEFVHRYLVQALRSKKLVIGYDYAFGKKRSGNFELLQSLGRKYGFQVQRIGPVYYDGEIVSSTRIRTLVEQGKVQEAKPLLNRFYQVQGIVVQGAGRGSKLLGIPTANLQPADKLCPKPGVYALWAELAGRPLPAVANVGYNPTFGESGLSVEAHILDFQGELYGQKLRLHFVQRIRDEVKFSGIEALLEQIHHDIQAARDILLQPGNQLHSPEQQTLGKNESQP